GGQQAPAAGFGVARPFMTDLQADESNPAGAWTAGSADVERATSGRGKQGVSELGDIADRGAAATTENPNVAAASRRRADAVFLRQCAGAQQRQRQNSRQFWAAKPSDSSQHCDSPL